MGGKPAVTWPVTLKGKENYCPPHEHRNRDTLFDKATGYGFEGLSSISDRDKKRFWN
jgi:hypothetical protein